MSSKNSNSIQIRNDRSVKKCNDKTMKKVDFTGDQSSSKTQKGFVEINKTKVSNFVVKREYMSNNPFANKNLKQANLKQVTESESRINLLEKIKFLEEELEKNECEKQFITEELDRICLEKDNQMKQLKSELYEKQKQIDHQMTDFLQNKNQFEEELNQYKQQIMDMKEEFRQKESKLSANNESLGKQLADLNDYVLDKKYTSDTIKQLEEEIKRQKIFNEKTKEKLINELENERERSELKQIYQEIRIGELVDERVNELEAIMERGCMSKLTVNARIALEKFDELAKNYEQLEGESCALRKINESLKQKLYKQRIDLEISESKLHEIQEQIQKTKLNRKEVAIQSDNTS